MAPLVFGILCGSGVLLGAAFGYLIRWSQVGGPLIPKRRRRRDSQPELFQRWREHDETHRRRKSSGTIRTDPTSPPTTPNK